MFTTLQISVTHCTDWRCLTDLRQADSIRLWKTELYSCIALHHPAACHERAADCDFLCRSEQRYCWPMEPTRSLESHWISTYHIVTSVAHTSIFHYLPCGTKNVLQMESVCAVCDFVWYRVTWNWGSGHLYHGLSLCRPPWQRSWRPRFSVFLSSPTGSSYSMLQGDIKLSSFRVDEMKRFVLTAVFFCSDVMYHRWWTSKSGLPMTRTCKVWRHRNASFQLKSGEPGAFRKHLVVPEQYRHPQSYILYEYIYILNIHRIRFAFCGIFVAFLTLPEFCGLARWPPRPGCRTSRTLWTTRSCSVAQRFQERRCFFAMSKIGNH